MEVDKSLKLVFNEFQRAVTEVPLEVYYQTVTSDQYSSSGFQFNIKQPGTNALLDCDVWIKYRIYIRSNNNFIPHIFYNTVGPTPLSQSNNRIALRGGNCVARCIHNLNIQINNSTLNVQPYKYMDVMNRLYVSNDQSEHEFSASGGRFDEGNHGHRTHQVTYRNIIDANAQYTDDNALRTATIYLHDGYRTNGAAAAAQAVKSQLRPPYPIEYDWYNPGFSRRFGQFALNARSAWNKAATADHGLDPSLATINQHLYRGSNTGDAAPNDALRYYVVDLYERLPIPIFKMYSTDGTYGVIPNVLQMQIQGNFLTKFKENFLHINAVTADVYIDWTLNATSDGTLYLRWFTPPVNYSIPREISIPYPKINTWSTLLSGAPVWAAANLTQDYISLSVQQYNITLEAIPDLLLIYVKYSPFHYTEDTPDDCMQELTNLIINIDNASGKLNQMTSLDLYLKWKKIVKHTDAKIINYHEWRKYCCVAALQPEDYGVRYGPGYSNQTVLGISCTALNWHNNPSALDDTNGGGQEILGGAAGAEGNYELFVTSLYNKNRFIIRADGTANQELLKIAADFNMTAPPGVLPPASA